MRARQDQGAREAEGWGKGPTVMLSGEVVLVEVVKVKDKPTLVLGAFGEKRGGAEHCAEVRANVDRLYANEVRVNSFMRASGEVMRMYLRKLQRVLAP